jgi:hypothetical protein
MASSPAGWLPQGIWMAAGLACAEDQTVGASLLAMASGQSTWRLKLMASSPAGWLPQGIWMAAGLACAEDQTVGASLLAMASGQSTWRLKLMASSPAGWLPQALKIKLWEPACWRWCRVRQHRYRMCRPHREQACSYRFCDVNQAFEVSGYSCSSNCDSFANTSG